MSAVEVFFGNSKQAIGKTGYRSLAWFFRESNKKREGFHAFSNGIHPSIHHRGKSVFRKYGFSVL